MSTSVEASLASLEHLLSNLPDTVPSAGNIYDFRGFLPDTYDATANSDIEEIEIAEPSGETFSIAADVDMSVVELRDMVSDKPITRSGPVAHLRPPAATSSTTEMVSWSYEAWSIYQKKLCNIPLITC